jgi:hypothetical protein
VGRARELLYGLGFTHRAVSHRTEDSVEFVELGLIDLQLVQKVARKSVELFGGFHQPVEDGIGIDFEDPCRASDANPSARQAMTCTMSSGEERLPWKIVPSVS